MFQESVVLFEDRFCRKVICSKHLSFFCRLTSGQNRLKIDFPRVRARQVVFVFFLHLFTGRSQRAVYQSVRGEGFEENAFTCSVADFAVGEAGRVARKYGGSVGKSGTFP